MSIYKGADLISATNLSSLTYDNKKIHLENTIGGTYNIDVSDTIVENSDSLITSDAVFQAIKKVDMNVNGTDPIVISKIPAGTYVYTKQSVYNSEDLYFVKSGASYISVGLIPEYVFNSAYYTEDGGTYTACTSEDVFDSNTTYYIEEDDSYVEAETQPTSVTWFAEFYTRSQTASSAATIGIQTATNSNIGVVKGGDGTSIGGNGEINVVNRLEEIAELPTASASNLGKCYLLTATQTGYQKGGTYQCQSSGDPATYSWVLISSAEIPIATNSVAGLVKAGDGTDIGSNGEVNVVNRLAEYEEVPSTPEDGDTFLYKGDDDNSFIKGHIYKYDETEVVWNDITDFQNKELSSAITVKGVEQTTVEGALGAINDAVESLPSIMTPKGSVTFANLPAIADRYVEVTPAGTENPSEEGWYEKVDDNYVLSEDTEVDSEKTYYEKVSPTVDVQLGWLYNITDAFVTTDEFMEGAGKSYGAGQNVVAVEYTEGVKKWDVLSGELNLSDYKTIWTGTRQAWTDLPTADKAKYQIVNFTDDTAEGGAVVVDEVTEGNMNACTSNSVYNALGDKLIFENETTENVTMPSMVYGCVDTNLAITKAGYILVSACAFVEFSDAILCSVYPYAGGKFRITYLNTASNPQTVPIVVKLLWMKD